MAFLEKLSNEQLIELLDEIVATSNRRLATLSWLKEAAALLRSPEESGRQLKVYRHFFMKLCVIENHGGPLGEWTQKLVDECLNRLPKPNVVIGSEHRDVMAVISEADENGSRVTKFVRELGELGRTNRNLPVGRLVDELYEVRAFEYVKDKDLDYLRVVVTDHGRQILNDTLR